MGLKCCIDSCSEKYSTATNVSFHQFPKNPDLREQWIQLINIEFSASARVCSKHFSNECFIQSAWSSRRVLKSDALPNVALKAEPNFEQNDSSLETESTQPGPLSRKRKAYVGDFQNSDIENDQENYIDVVNTTIAKKNKRIKTLYQKNKRLQQKVKDLHTLVDELKNNEMITEDVASILLSKF